MVCHPDTGSVGTLTLDRDSGWGPPPRAFPRNLQPLNALQRGPSAATLHFLRVEVPSLLIPPLLSHPTPRQRHPYRHSHTPHFAYCRSRHRLGTRSSLLKMALKRKRSSCELGSSPSASSTTSSSFSFSSPPHATAMPAISWDNPPRVSFPPSSHLHSRTMKRFRDNRPSEEEVHRE